MKKLKVEVECKQWGLFNSCLLVSKFCFLFERRSHTAKASLSLPDLPAFGVLRLHACAPHLAEKLTLYNTSDFICTILQLLNSFSTLFFLFSTWKNIKRYHCHSEPVSEVKKLIAGVHHSVSHCDVKLVVRIACGKMLLKPDFIVCLSFISRHQAKRQVCIPSLSTRSIVFPLGLSSFGPVFLPTQSCTPGSLLPSWWFLTLWPGKKWLSIYYFETTLLTPSVIFTVPWTIYGRLSLAFVSYKKKNGFHEISSHYVVLSGLKLWSSCLSLPSARIYRHAPPRVFEWVWKQRKELKWLKLIGGLCIIRMEVGWGLERWLTG